MSRQVNFMDRAVYKNPTGGGRRSSTFRPSMLGAAGTQLLDLDLEDFDASLGCPLNKYENATLALVGGKALQCWRLARQGFPVPNAFIIPTYVYSLHVEDAGVASLISEAFSSGSLTSLKAKEENEKKLAMIREKIMSTSLRDEVVENLAVFLDALPPNAEVAVRSSGSAEDLAAQSFAGQYDTLLYKRTIDEVVESVKACWASMFKAHILEYALKSVFMSPVKDFVDEPGAVAGAFKAPQMGVLVMQMVQSEKAGVCFSRNIWGDPSEVMVEAVYGQGEGLVGGEITPDRYVVDKISTQVVYKTLNRQTHKFIRSSNMDGVEKVELPHNTVERPVLSQKELRALTLLARSVEDFYARPQDIEWAIDKTGSVFILQSRAITTLGDPKSLSFLPPGDGFYTYDPTHFPRPLSPWMQECYSFEYSLPRAKKMGSLMQGASFRFVHGFAYSQPILADSTDALERAAGAYWSKRLYEDDYREFTDFFRPETEHLQDELRSVNPEALSHSSLVKYVARCYDLAAEFWKLHHTYSYPALVIVGDFMNRMAELSGKGEMETLVLLEGSSPESRGLLNREDPLLSEMYELLSKSEQAQQLLQSDESSARWALDCLLHFPGRLGDVMRQVENKYGWRLAGGYDLVTPALIETPHFFLRTLLQGVSHDPKALETSRQKVQAIVDEWRSSIPAEKQGEFDEILALGRQFFRMRDERGLCTDLSGVGLCRRGVLEAGRRLVDQGIIFKAEHLCVATKYEAISLLRGDLGLLGNQQGQYSSLELPTPRELERRFDYVQAADPNLIPKSLGVPPQPRDPLEYPPNIRRTMEALNTSLIRGVYDEGRMDETILGDDVVKGVAASMGVTEGRVRLILDDGDLQKVRKGDIAVTYSCSASFNIVISLCAGIITDFGGMLSHAAIVAREYGIPAIVGTQEATKKFKDGDIVRIDSSTGMATVVTRV